MCGRSDVVSTLCNEHVVDPVQSNSSMHHYECIALCKDISLQRDRFYLVPDL